VGFVVRQHRVNPGFVLKEGFSSGGRLSLSAVGTSSSHGLLTTSPGH
jgi:hypothetical protein